MAVQEQRTPGRRSREARVDVGTLGNEAVDLDLEAGTLAKRGKMLAAGTLRAGLAGYPNEGKRVPRDGLGVQLR